MQKYKLAEIRAGKSKFDALVSCISNVVAGTVQYATVHKPRSWSSSVASHDGAIIVIDNSLHLGSVSETVKRILEYFGSDMHEGDVVMTNDSYGGGSHLQDFLILKPFFCQRKLVSYFAVRSHFIDMGGNVLGGYNAEARDIWAEGVRVTPIKIHSGGKEDEHLLNTVLLNTRFPETVKANIDIMTRALRQGEQRANDFVDDSGLTLFIKSMEQYISDTAKQLRERISNWPDGKFYGECKVDHNITANEDVTVMVNVKVQGDSLEFDFSGSDNQSKSYINSPRGNTCSYALFPLFMVVDGLSANTGVLQPITIKTKTGSVVDPIIPAPTGLCPFHVGTEIAMAISNAFDTFLPSGNVARRCAEMLNISLML